MSKSEDVVPAEYTYSWNTDSSIPLQDFLTKYKPSMIQNDGEKPWIWVQGSAPTREDCGIQSAIEEASALLKEVTQKVEAIKNDESIPLRSNKKTGAKSKKEVREQVQAEATGKLKDIAIKHGYVSGKWLIFVSADKVDIIWSNLATSLVSGPLSSTYAYLAKAATSPEQDSPNYQHLICVYIPDVYDKVKVTEVMRVLLRNHGVSLSGVKSNLYTALGIDSKHASGLPSTTWKNSALINDGESKELRDAFFAELASKKVTPAEKLPATAKDDVAVGASNKPKPKLKREKAADDPFASDNDDDNKSEDEKKRKQELQAKVKKAVPKKQAKDDAFASDEEDEGEAKRKEEIQTKKSKSALNVKKRQGGGGGDVDDDDDEDQRPKKRRPAKSQG